jgi:hypothetical protein
LVFGKPENQVGLVRPYDHRFLAPFFHELARRGCQFYPAPSWFAALARADCEKPGDQTIPIGKLVQPEADRLAQIITQSHKGKR